MERGRVVVDRISSEVLKGNPLGDPTERDLFVYLPPGYDDNTREYPVLVGLAGFTGTGGKYFNVDPLGGSLDQRLDRMIGSGACPPVIVAAPDCFTRVGGTQYLNSTAVGRYEDHVVEEIVPHLRNRYRAGRFGVFGKSSGGYGALRLGMRHPDVFEAVADHSGDANFELCYLPEFGSALTEWAKAGGPGAWLDQFWSDVPGRGKGWHAPLNLLAMAAHYSPNPASPHLGSDCPFDLETGEFDPEVWERWRAFDPVNLVPDHAGNLRELRLLIVDCGRRDEFHLQWGARALVQALRAHDVPVRHEEFDGGHFSTDYRYETTLPLLAEALAG